MNIKVGDLVFTNCGVDICLTCGLCEVLFLNDADLAVQILNGKKRHGQITWVGHYYVKQIVSSFQD